MPDQQTTDKAAGRHMVVSAVGEGLARLPQLLAESYFASVLGKSRYGVWKSLQVILYIGGFCNLGITSGTVKELPRALGASDAQGARAIERAGLGSLVGVMLIVAGSLALFHRAPWFRSYFALEGHSQPFYLLLIALLTGQLMTLYQAFLRAALRFVDVATSTLLFAVVFFAVGAALIRSIGVSAVVIGYFGGGLLASAYAQVRLGHFVWPAFDRTLFRRLVRVGMPLLVYGALQWAFLFSDRLVIMGKLTVNELGVYGVAALVPYAVQGLAGAAARGLLPVLMRRIGAREGLTESRTLLVALVTVVTMLGALLYGGLLPLTLPAVRTFLPAYGDAVLPLWLLLAGSYFFIIALSMYSFAVAADGQRAMNIYAAIAIALNVVLALVLISRGWRLQAVATSTLVAEGAFSLLLLRLGCRSVGMSSAETLRTMLWVMAPGALIAALWLGGGQLIGWAALDNKGVAPFAWGLAWSCIHVVALGPLMLLALRRLRRAANTTTITTDE